MRLSLLTMAASAGAALAAARPPATGYGIEEMQWDFEVAPGQTERLNGTYEEVVAQARQINPDFVTPAAAPAGVQARDGRPLGKRNRIDCKTNYFGADAFKLMEGVDHLRGLSGGPTQGPGPGNCGRVSCSWRAAIYICNDAPTPHHFDSWDWIANSAAAILGTCPARGGNKIAGQNFEDGRWSVIVRDDDC